jgi:signal transduction histidine kinase
LHLCYNRLRAKYPSFYSTLQTNFDDSIEKIYIVPEDIGKVLLNIIGNSFYAVGEKKKSPHTLKGGKNYEPVVTVTTKSLSSPSGNGGGVEIRVRDNGIGIPQELINRVFHPFFTTKPTGQGTGLGLSLSYDIITKGHGGQIKVKSKEGEFTEFIIQLPNV